jgi:hypothetical protein
LWIVVSVWIFGDGLNVEGRRKLSLIGWRMKSLGAIDNS